MPETWGFAISMLQKNPKNPFPLTRGEIRLHSGCGSDVLTALYRMGDIRHFEHNGKMYPTLNENLPVPTAAEIRKKIREMNERRDAQFVEVIKEAQEAGVFPTPGKVGSTAENWKRSLQERGMWQPEPVASLSEAIAVITAAGGTVVFGDKKQ